VASIPAEVRSESRSQNVFPSLLQAGSMTPAITRRRSKGSWKLSNYKKLRAEQPEAAKQGRHLGIDLCYVELAGVGPFVFFRDSRRRYGKAARCEWADARSL